jgi:hypothetical protein
VSGSKEEELLKVVDISFTGLEKPKLQCKNSA